MTTSFPQTFVQLWRGSSRWQNLVLAVGVSTVMAFVSMPGSSGPPPGNTYSPPGQSISSGTSQPPPVTRRDASSSPQVLTTVAPAIPKIAPGQKAKGVVIERESRPMDDDFGQYIESESNVIKPSYSASDSP